MNNREDLRRALSTLEKEKLVEIALNYHLELGYIVPRPYTYTGEDDELPFDDDEQILVSYIYIDEPIKLLYSVIYYKDLPKLKANKDIDIAVLYKLPDLGEFANFIN